MDFCCARQNCRLCHYCISADGTLFFGSNDNFMYAVNGATGFLSWKFKAGNGIQSTPAIAASGAVFFGSSNDNLIYALPPASTISKPSALGISVTHSKPQCIPKHDPLANSIAF